jgi:hypothetical protein
VGRGRLVWFLCLCALLAGFWGAQVNPVAYLLVGVLTPLPVLVAGWRSGALAALAVAVSTLAVIFSLHPSLAIFWQNLGFLNLLILGVVLSTLQCRGVSAPYAIIWTVVGLNVIAVLIFLGQAFIQGISPEALLVQKTTEIMETVRQIIGEAGTGSLVPGVAAGDVERLLERLLPGLMVANMGLVAWLNVVLARQISFALSWGEPSPPLYHWTVPVWVIFMLLGAGFLLLVPVSWVRFAGVNLVLVLAIIYFTQGVAVVATWFHRLGIPRPLRVLGYPLLFLNPVIFLIITLGLMDLWLDFRRLHQPKES